MRIITLKICLTVKHSFRQKKKKKQLNTAIYEHFTRARVLEFDEQCPREVSVRLAPSAFAQGTFWKVVVC